MLRNAEHDALATLRRFFFDTALSTSTNVLRSLTSLVPTSQLLLGTDFPMAQEIGLFYTLDGLTRYAGFGDADRLNITSGNARALLKLASRSPRRNSA
jgi:predicted TIM-barrel fold metal-dependent hydrolase